MKLKRFLRAATMVLGPFKTVTALFASLAATESGASTTTAGLVLLVAGVATDVLRILLQHRRFSVNLILQIELPILIQ